ncbi:K+-sensing histidine kinase KdpD [Caulobacter ginsengisoli]|uniref:histidine kinase n=1 Tax=Caulobacter ginsengisoli TaxID=400775 RepID=A0ABU0IU58_9CAUL|nr:ATP-binding protein [Caulobacter ginsengisoli]MDQ0465529.1 K+-sensing histidine kinase KdpD [Caulobacter ginsengisoli]
MSAASPHPFARFLAAAPAHLGGAALVGLAALVASGIDGAVENADLAMVFMLAVLAAGLSFGLWPALSAAALAALTYDLLFLEPRMTLVIGHAGDGLTFAVFFAVAVATGGLSGRIRDQSRAVSSQADTVAALLAASRRFSAAADRCEAAEVLAEHLALGTGGQAVVLLPGAAGLEIVARSPVEAGLEPEDLAQAERVLAGGQPAESGAWRLYPLAERVGVAGVDVTRVGAQTDAPLVAALLDQGGVALERARLAAQAADGAALHRSDRLRSALLNSVSHDLRTPLSTVLGAATTLIDLGKSIRPAVRNDLLLSIREEAERLSRYVGDLLDMTRLEGGALVARRDWTDVREVLAAAAARVTPRLDGRTLGTDFPAELSLVRCDAALLEQALVNILENAIAYSRAGAAIETAAHEDRGNVVISVEDQGRGIPTGELEQVFERFRRLEEPSDRGKGAGLGLAIAKGFVEAMGGRIAAASPIQDGRGTRILISLKKEIETPGHML